MHCSLIVNDFSVKPRKLNLVPVFKNVLHVSVITFAYVYQNTKKFPRRAKSAYANCQYLNKSIFVSED